MLNSENIKLMKSKVNILVMALFIIIFGTSCFEDYPIDEDGLLITDRAECFVSNFELLDVDHQTVRSTPPVIDTVAQTIDVEVFWGTNLTQVWPRFSLVTDAKLEPKITGWEDFSDLNNPRQWTVISGNREIRKTYTVNITVQQGPETN